MADKKVTIIPTVKSVDPPEIVVSLQEMLEQARSGEIIELVAVTVNPEGEAVYTNAGVEDGFRLLGLMYYLMQTLFAEYSGAE